MSTVWTILPSRFFSVGGEDRLPNINSNLRVNLSEEAHDSPEHGNFPTALPTRLTHPHRPGGERPSGEGGQRRPKQERMSTAPLLSHNIRYGHPARIFPKRRHTLMF